MYLKELSVFNFKNYIETECNFHEKINCFVGNNGSGKTNLLDAIHYLSLCKSYFNLSDQQNINHQQEYFVINGIFNKNGKEDSVICSVKRNTRKVFKLNKNEYEKLSLHIGLFPLIIIAPYDTLLIFEGSDDRRKYLDLVISQYDKVYLETLMAYNKILLQRNALLKWFLEHKKYDAAQLEVWDEQLCRLSAPLFNTRKEFLLDFVQVFRDIYKFISQENEEADLIYQSQLMQAPLEVWLKQNQEKDKFSGYTNAGIHKDDLLFQLGAYPLKRFGSQGQQKSFIIALKLAQFEYTRQKVGFKPLLLLDDIFDKLDTQRIMQLLKMVSMDNFGQIFITDAHPERIAEIFNSIEVQYRTFEIAEGTVVSVVDK